MEDDSFPPKGILIQVEPGRPNFTPHWYESEAAKTFAIETLQNKIKYDGKECEQWQIDYMLNCINHASEVGQIIRSSRTGNDPYRNEHYSHSQTLVDTEIPWKYQTEENERVANIAQKAEDHGYAVIVHAAGADNVQTGLGVFTPEYEIKRVSYEDNIERPNILLCRAGGNHPWRRMENGEMAIDAANDSAQSGVVVNGFANDIAVGVGTSAGVDRGITAEGDNGVDLFVNSRPDLPPFTSFAVPYAGVYAKKLMDDFYPQIPSHYIKLAMLLAAEPKSNEPGKENRADFCASLNANGMPWGIHEGSGYLEIPRRPDEEGLWIVDRDAIASTRAYKLLEAWRNASKALASLSGDAHAGFPALVKTRVCCDKPCTEIYEGPLPFEQAALVRLQCDETGNPLDARLSFKLSDEAKEALAGKEHTLRIFLRSPQGTLLRLKSPGTVFTEGRLTTSALMGEEMKGEWQVIMTADGVAPEKLEVSDILLWLRSVPREQDISRMVTPEDIGIRKYAHHWTKLPFYEGNAALGEVTPPDEKKLRELYGFKVSPELKSALRHYLTYFGRDSTSLKREPFTDEEAQAVRNRYRDARLSRKEGAAMFGVFDAPFIRDLTASLEHFGDAAAGESALILKKGLSEIEHPKANSAGTGSDSVNKMQAVLEQLAKETEIGSAEENRLQGWQRSLPLFGGREHFRELLSPALGGVAIMAAPEPSRMADQRIDNSSHSFSL